MADSRILDYPQPVGWWVVPGGASFSVYDDIPSRWRRFWHWSLLGWRFDLNTSSGNGGGSTRTRAARD